jgi:hypothetical protein
MLLAVVFAISTCLAFSCPEYGQAQQQTPAGASPSDLALDAMLAAQDWNGLEKALSQQGDPATVNKNLDWLDAKIHAGDGFLLSFIYMKEMWAIGSAVNESDPKKDLRMTAGMMALYNYELIAIDGAECEDKSAAGNRLDQLLF